MPLRLHAGGTTFSQSAPDPVLVGPVCAATMVSVAANASGGKRAIFHANPGHGTDIGDSIPPNGRASGTIRRSMDGGQTWQASVNITGHEAYSYSCLTKVPEAGYIGLAYETVLPGSSLYNTSDASANNIVFTLIPQNFTNI